MLANWRLMFSESRLGQNRENLKNTCIFPLLAAYDSAQLHGSLKGRRNHPIRRCRAGPGRLHFSQFFVSICAICYRKAFFRGTPVRGENPEKIPENVGNKIRGISVRKLFCAIIFSGGGDTEITGSLGAARRLAGRLGVKCTLRARGLAYQRPAHLCAASFSA